MLGYSGHERVHEQPSKCPPPEGHAHNTSDLGSWRLHPLPVDMCRKEEHPGSVWKFRVWTALSSNRDNGAIL